MKSVQAEILVLVLDYSYSRVGLAMSRRVGISTVALPLARGVPSEVERKIVRPA
ncbi:MAG TPA: hypothetical protein VF089_14110 [Candidatus Binatia bacterium]